MVAVTHSDCAHMIRVMQGHLSTPTDSAFVKETCPALNSVPTHAQSFASSIACSMTWAAAQLS